MRGVLLGLFVAAWGVIASGQEIRLYTSVDQPRAAKVIREFEKRTGMTVKMLTDAEATKTVGLAERLRTEKNNPRADVWWSNEIFHTIRLANEGILAEYESPTAKDIPQIFVDPQKRWAAAAIRIRMIIATPDTEISGYRDLLDPRLRGRIILAKPVFGTTGGHVAAMYVLLGEEKYVEYLRGLKANGLKLVGGNATAADMVGKGQFAAAFTDNDDVAEVIENGGKVKAVVPDQEPDGIGTLAIPCSAGLVKGAPNPEAAKKLIDFLLSREVEQMLVDEKFAHASVRDTATTLKVMQVDYKKAAEVMPHAVRMALKELE